MFRLYNVDGIASIGTIQVAIACYDSGTDAGNIITQNVCVFWDEVCGSYFQD